MILVGNNSVIMQKAVHCGGLPSVVQKRENSFRNIVRKWDSLFLCGKCNSNERSSRSVCGV